MTDTTPTLTPQERAQLAAAIRKAAEGIAEVWAIINAISSRASFDWIPRNTSIGEIAGDLAAILQTPADAAKISTQDITERFLDRENWSRPWMRTGPREVKTP